MLVTLWWTVFWAASAALAVGSAGFFLSNGIVARLMVSSLYRYSMRELTGNRYPMNLASMLNLMRRADPQIFLENMLRTRADQPLARPMGGPVRTSPWDKLVFNPAQVAVLPTPTVESIDMQVTLGPKAKHPLRCDIPILLAGMSFAGALSEPTKIALADAADRVGTATNTGENYLPAERDHVRRLIVQYHRGTWPKSAQNYAPWLEQADAIEVQLGQGAQAAATRRTSSANLSPDMRRIMGLHPGEDAVIESRLKGVEHPEDVVRRLRDLKARYTVPVGVKLAPSARLTDDLALVLAAEPDFITLDGGEGGTHAGPPILQDDFGLPLMVAVQWTHTYLQEHGLRHRVSILAAGGLRTPGDFLKAMALGADAVYIGFAALMAMAAVEAPQVMPWAPPEALFYAQGPSRRRMQVDRAAQALAHFLKSCTAEMAYGVEALGLTRVADVGPRDVVALDPWTAKLAGVPSLVDASLEPAAWEKRRTDIPSDPQHVLH